MAIIYGIDYGNMKFSDRHKLDKMAYAKYYSAAFDDPWGNIESFNTWYGSNSHKKLITPLLRKEKLKKINNLKN